MPSAASPWVFPESSYPLLMLPCQGDLGVYIYFSIQHEAHVNQLPLLEPTCRNSKFLPTLERKHAMWVLPRASLYISERCFPKGVSRVWQKICQAHLYHILEIYPPCVMSHHYTARFKLYSSYCGFPQVPSSHISLLSWPWFKTCIISKIIWIFVVLVAF